MKKKLIFTSLIAGMMSLFALPAFADDYYSYDSTRSTDISYSAGFRLSFLLGFEPEVSVTFNNLEISAFAPLSESVTNNEFGWGIGGSIGVNSKPHGRGWQNGFGASYLFLSPSFFRTKFDTIIDVAYADAEEDTIIGETRSDDSTTDVSMHIASLYYRGGVKFNELWGLNFRIFMPVFALLSDGNETQHISILSGSGAALSFLCIPCSISLGVRFEF